MSSVTLTSRARRVMLALAAAVLVMSPLRENCLIRHLVTHATKICMFIREHA